MRNECGWFEGFCWFMCWGYVDGEGGLVGRNRLTQTAYQRGFLKLADSEMII